MIKDEKVVSRFINGTWHKSLNEINEVEYYKRLDNLKMKWHKMRNFFYYLFHTWLNPLTHKFVRVWISKVLHFGVETTNQVESEYSVLKLWLSTCHGDLDTVFLNINSDIKGNNISHLALKKIWVELKKAPKIIDDPKNKPGHYLKTSHGLPCSCKLITRTRNWGAYPVSQEKDMDAEMRDLAFLLDQIST
ncbi:hypothetical protein M9H77_31289 [Catharanthus roseus]|uniref:Uncharacterized protein n=1 Tax=Catharanthus roseus TaxID=4058 RepID=A0ACB9ZZQ7_CATRO|nr:hypothetical protein M9H77_31289 [Catharanthus roseus]